MRDAIWVRWLKWIVGAEHVPAKVRVPARWSAMRVEHLDDRRLPSMNPMWLSMSFGSPFSMQAEFTSASNETDIEQASEATPFMCHFHHHPLMFGGWFGGSPWGETVSTEANHFDVQLLSDAYSGETVRMAVVALDESNQPVRDYEGTIHFTSSDPTLELPDDYTFTASDRGVKVFEITTTNVGALTITVTETTTTPTDEPVTEPATDDIVDEPTDDITDDIVDEPTSAISDPTEAIIDEPTDIVEPEPASVVEEPIDEVIDDTEHTHEEVTEEITDDLLDEPTDEITDDFLDEPTDEITDDFLDEPTDDTTDDGLIDEVADIIDEPDLTDPTDIIDEPTDTEPVEDVVDEVADEPVEDVITETEPVVAELTPSGTITINISTAPVATHFVIRSLPSVLADQPSQYMVVALDESNRPVTNYNGTLDISSTDATATLPDEITFTDANRGVYVFAAEFDTSGVQTLSVNDTANTDLTGAVAVNVLTIPTNFLTLPGFGIGGNRWWW